MLLSFCLPETVLAFGHTTVLQEHYADGNAEGVVPYVDGLKEQYLENNLNHVIKEKANALGKAAGARRCCPYQITWVNRPTLFSVIPKAEGDKTVYDGLNLDTTSGKEVEPRDLLYTNTAEYTEKLLGKDFVFRGKRDSVAGGSGGRVYHQCTLCVPGKIHQCGGGGPAPDQLQADPRRCGQDPGTAPGELVALYLDANPPRAILWQLFDQSSQGGFANLGHSFFLPFGERIRPKWFSRQHHFVPELYPGRGLQDKG